MVRERVHIETNDPQRPRLSVSVTGMVEKFADIRPERVQLAGPAGKPLSAVVEIIPRKEYPFTIGDIKPRLGDFITYELLQRCGDGKDRCILRVENTRREKGRYVDHLQIATDSALRPQISVYVIGVIQ